MRFSRHATQIIMAPTKHIPLTHIPVLDVSAIHSSDAGSISRLATEFFRIYSSVGFSYIINHGVPDKLIERVFCAAQRFHALPVEKKMAVELNDLHRGFIPINTSTDVNSTLADISHPNQSESFMVMREDDQASPSVMHGDYLAGPNQWPELAGFRADVMAYKVAMTELAARLVTVVAGAIGAEQDFIGTFQPPTSWLRLLYYPPGDRSVDRAATGGVYGSAPHTDFGCLTLLAQDDIGGLQVQSVEGDWIDVPRVPGSFVLNVGDMLHRWSNGLLRSTPHRVINVSARARYSCPFFYDPHVNTTIEPLPSCISDSHPAKFEPINFGEFLKAELEAGYSHHKKA